MDHQDELNLSLLHIDKVRVRKLHSTEIWNRVAKTYLDWILLQKMDFLVISSSGFSETSSLFSQKPTWQIRHEKSLRTEESECLVDEYGDSDTPMGW